MMMLLSYFWVDMVISSPDARSAPAHVATDSKRRAMLTLCEDHQRDDVRDSKGLHPVYVLESRLGTLSVSLRKCMLQLAQTSAQEMIQT
jgi:hypothetical protein